MSNFQTSTVTGMSGGGFTLGAQNPSGTGFSFGQPQTTTTSAIKGFLSTPAVTSTSGGFNFGTLGTSTATGVANPGGMPFGSVAPTALPGQTAAAPAMGGFSLGTAPPATTGVLPFGAGSSTALTGQTTAVPTMGGGFSLGTAPPAATGMLPFGAGSSTALTGQTTAVPAMGGGFSLGTAPPASTGGLPFGFGYTTALPGQTTAVPAMAGFSLGSAAPATTGMLPFGAGSSTALTGQTTAVPAMGGGFSLGTAPPATTGGMPFGSAVSTALTGQTIAVPSMGGYPLGTATTATTAGVGGFAFGSTATTSLTGQTTTVPAMGGFALGTSTSAAPATTSGFSFGGAGATGATTSTGFSLGGGATITPIPSAATGFSLGGMGTAPPPSNTGFPVAGLGGSAPALAASTGFSFGNTAQTTVAKPAFGFGMPNTTLQISAAPDLTSVGLGGAGMGLGGAQPPSANAGANSNGAKSDGKSAKKQQMPHDLYNAIAVFETWRNGENSASEENIRQTAAPFHKVGKKAEEIQQLLAELASEYLQLHASAVNLKAEVMKEAEHVEMARRTKDTPMALQGENKSPEVYFINLVRFFEAEMMYCRNKIDEVSLCMQAANNPCETPDDIAEVLQREHEALKELASKVYAKHTQLVELSQRLNTKTVPNEQAFFREQSKMASTTPPSAVVRPALGGPRLCSVQRYSPYQGSSSGLQAFQEQQQRAKAVTLGAAPPTMPLAQTNIPSLFGSNTGSSMFSGGSSFGTNTFNLGNTVGNTSFGSKSLFGNTSTGLGNNMNFGMNTAGIQQASSSSPFSMNSSFNTKPFEEDPDVRRKRRL